MKDLYKIKLELLHYGVCVTINAYKNLRKGNSGNISINDYITTKGLLLVLNNESYVTTNIKINSKYKLDYASGEYFLIKNDYVCCGVKVISPPLFALNNVKLKNGKSVRSIVNIQGDRLRISPIHGCANSCKFCDLNNKKYYLNPIEDIIEAIEVALKENEVKHFLISGGSPFDKKDEYDYLNTVYEIIGSIYGEKYPIDIMMCPRGLKVTDETEEDYELFLKKLKSWNISGLSINLELYNDELRKKLIPQKNLIGKNEYFKFIATSVKVFGKGNVRSCIVVGIESKEDTLKAVEELASIGCMPVLCPYVPIDDKIDSPSVEFMDSVLLRTAEITKKYKVGIGPLCDPCKHNTIHFK